MDRDEILRVLQLKAEIDENYSTTIESLAGPIADAQAYIAQLRDSGELAVLQSAVAQLDQIGQPIVTAHEGIQRGLATLADQPRLASLDAGMVSALASAAKLAVDHPAISMMASTAKILDAAGIDSAIASYDKISRDLAAPFLTADARRVIDEMQFNVGSVGESLEKMFSRIELPDGSTALLATKSAAIEEATKAISRSLEPEMWHAFGFPDVKDAERFNDMLVKSLAAPAWRSVANVDSVLEDALNGLSDTYAGIYSSIVGAPEFSRDVPDFVVTLPPRDMVVKTEIVATRTTEYNPDEATIDLSDPAYARDDVDHMLAELDMRFVTILDEAFEAIGGKTIGRKRHVCASLREVCRQVLHGLSPDAELRKWNSNPEFYPQGKPTRRLRLMYISRRIAHGGFPDYLEKTIAMHQKLMETLNEMHNVQPNLDEFQLRLLFTDAIAMLRFLLRTGRY